MAEIFEFPGADARQWPEVEAGIRASLFQVGAPAGMADWICQDMRPRFLEVRSNISVAIPPACRAAAETVASVLREIVSARIAQMVGLEAELYIAKFLGPGSHNAPASAGDTARKAAEIVQLFKGTSIPNTDGEGGP
jgi:hypothetical protein